MSAVRVPAWLRHAAIVWGSTAAGVVLQAMADARGVTRVPWHETLVTALDTGATATAAGMLLLVSTSATRQYGSGSGSGSGRGRHEAGAPDG